MSRRPLAAFVTALLVALGVGGAVSPAFAADDGIEFSQDGTGWSADAPAALFEVQPVLVPGTGWTSSIRIRNASEGAARISVFITNIELSGPDAADTFVMSATDGMGGRFSETPVGAIGDCTSLIPQRVLGSGGEIDFAVTVQIPATVNGTRGMNASTSFDFAIGLADPAVPEAETCPTSAEVVPAFPTTPSTGAPVSGDGSRGGALTPVTAEAGSGAAEPGLPVTADRTPIDQAAEFVSCDVRAFAASFGAPVALCPEAFVSDGAATTLMFILVLIAIAWFLIVWRRRHKEDDDEHELEDTLVTGGSI